MESARVLLWLLLGGIDEHGGKKKGKWEMAHQQDQAWDEPGSLKREGRETYQGNDQLPIRVSC